MQLNKGSPGFATMDAIVLMAAIVFIAASMTVHWHFRSWLIVVLVFLCIAAPLFAGWGARTFKKQKPDITKYHNPPNRKAINYLVEQTIAETHFGAIIPPDLMRCVEITFKDGHRLSIREQCGYYKENGCFRSSPTREKRAIPISGERDEWLPITLEQLGRDIDLYVWYGDEDVRIDCYGISKSIRRIGRLVLKDINLPQ